MIADAARDSVSGGGNSCCDSSGDEGGDRSGRKAGESGVASGGGGGGSGGYGRGGSGPRAGKRAVCRGMARSARLHAEHAEIGQRKEERRKVSNPNGTEHEGTVGAGEVEGCVLMSCMAVLV